MPPYHARSLGAIAQLGERVNGIHEVGSSILPGSTNPTSTAFVDAVLPPNLCFLSNDIEGYGG